MSTTNPVSARPSDSGTASLPSAEQSRQAAQQLVQNIIEQHNISAASFIVTLYGDVVEPRGGVLWMGSMIQACAAVDITENQVRTAVSRLVRAGQFQGERLGRRSFYRLTAAARDEFNYAAQVIYALKAVQQWQMVYVGGDDTLMRRLRRLGYVSLNPRLALGPDHTPLPQDILVWQIQLVQGQNQFADFIAEHWDLAQYEQAYQQFIELFQPVAGWVSQLTPQLALTLRLLMVHQYRQVVLRTPQLPAPVVPEHSLAMQARALFARLYARLSKVADQFIASAFENRDGALPKETGKTIKRLDCLAALDRV